MGKSKYSVRFDEMTWPTYSADVSELSNKLRYHPESLEKTEALVLASVVDAYLALVGKTQKRRNYICEKIKELSEVNRETKD